MLGLIVPGSGLWRVWRGEGGRSRGFLGVRGGIVGGRFVVGEDREGIVGKLWLVGLGWWLLGASRKEMHLAQSIA